MEPACLKVLQVDQVFADTCRYFLRHLSIGEMFESLSQTGQLQVFSRRMKSFNLLQKHCAEFRAWEGHAQRCSCALLGISLEVHGYLLRKAQFPVVRSSGLLVMQGE